jgi:O-antigen ligase
LLSKERKKGGVMQIGEIVVRFELINRSFQMVKDRPLGGVGLAQFVPASLEAYKGRGTVAESADEVIQHNHLLGLAVELGIFGLLVYLIPIILIFRRLYQMRGRIPETGFMGTNFLILCTVIWISYLNVNMFLEPSFFLFYNAVPFMFGGIADGVYSRYIIT